MSDGASSSHARNMDAIYRTQRHFYDLTRKYYLLGRDSLLRDLRPAPGAHVLEVGCGTARNLIAAARYWPLAEFYGFDISAAMLETARRSVARKGLADRIQLKQGDASANTGTGLFGGVGFDRVFMSYTLSMIPDWKAAIRLAAQSVAPGGELHIVDFGQQERLPELFRRGLFKWLGKFDVSPRAGLADVLEAIARDEAMTCDFRPAYRGYAWAARLARA